MANIQHMLKERIMKKTNIIDAKKRFIQRQGYKKLLQSRESYIARILAGKIEDPPLQTAQEIMREFFSNISLESNRDGLLRLSWKKLN